jgi:hypothetical protein
MNNKNLSQNLQSIISSLNEEIINSSDAEILTVYNELSLDPNEGPKRLRAYIQDSISSMKRSSLNNARSGYEAALKAAFTSKVSEDKNAQKELLDKITKSSNEKGLTIRFRDGDENALIGNDLKTVLEDLAELGGTEETK